MTSQEPYLKNAYLSVGAIAVAAFVATLFINTPVIQVASGFAPFAVVYIVAQALERFLEPFSELKSTGAEEKNEAKKKVVEKRTEVRVARRAFEASLIPAEGRDTDAMLAKQQNLDLAKDAATQASTDLGVIERKRAVLFWAIASILGLVISATLGLGLIQSVASVNGGHASDFFRGVDVVVTGIAIGAGTKPLHDLIEVLQETKKEKKGNGAAAAAT